MIEVLAALFVIAAFLMFVLKRLDLPVAPIYIGTGFLVSYLAERVGYLEGGLGSEVLVQEIAVMGLGLLVFYSSSRFILDQRRRTTVDAFKTSSWLILVSFTLFAGISLFVGLEPAEAAMFGLAAAVGSTLFNSGRIEEQARENHIHGWITEDIQLFEDIIAVVGITVILSYGYGLGAVASLVLSMALILGALTFRDEFEKFGEYLVLGKEELYLLLGVSLFAGSVVGAELLGLTPLLGVFVGGILLADTELGVKIRERLSSVKDFFMAVAMFSIGALIDLPSFEHLIITLSLIVFVAAVKPLLATFSLRLQGYDYRTAFLSSSQLSEISEITLLAAVLTVPVMGTQTLSAVTVAFAATSIISRVTENRDDQLFEYLLGEEEYEPEMVDLPGNLEDHVIIAGFDYKGQRALNAVPDRYTKVIVDFDLERIEEAESSGLFHVLGDMNSGRTWKKLDYKNARLIVSGSRRKEINEAIKALETNAQKLYLGEDEISQETVNRRISEKLRETLEKEEKRS